MLCDIADTLLEAFAIVINITSNKSVTHSCSEDQALLIRYWYDVKIICLPQIFLLTDKGLSIVVKRVSCIRLCHRFITVLIVSTSDA